MVTSALPVPTVSIGCALWGTSGPSGRACSACSAASTSAQPAARNSDPTTGPTMSTTSTCTPGASSCTRSTSAVRSDEPGVRPIRTIPVPSKRSAMQRGGRLGPLRTTSSRRHRTRAACPFSSARDRARAGTGLCRFPPNAPPLPRGEAGCSPGRHQLASGSTWAGSTQVEPAYVEPDASWCRPGEQPASPLGNGGAFGGKRHSPVPARARSLADENGQAARVRWRREDVVRRGPKRPPLCIALRFDGTGIVRIGRTPGSSDLTALVERVHELAPGVQVKVVDIVGPVVGSELRAAGWAEVLAALHALQARPEGPEVPHNAQPMLTVGTGRADVTMPGGGRAVVAVHPEDRDGGRNYLEVDVWAGEVLCPVTLRSYALGAVHQALGMVWSEGIAVDETGEPVDLTIRSFGILAARDMPEVVVRLHEGDGWPVNGSDAVFVATLAAAWIAEGRPLRWPTRRAAVRAPRRDVAASAGREEIG